MAEETEVFYLNESGRIVRALRQFPGGDGVNSFEDHYQALVYFTVEHHSALFDAIELLDRKWFEDQPDRSYRLRRPFPIESAGIFGPHPKWIVSRRDNSFPAPVPRDLPEFFTIEDTDFFCSFVIEWYSLRLARDDPRFRRSALLKSMLKLNS